MEIGVGVSVSSGNLGEEGAPVSPPDAFVNANWSVATGLGDGELEVTIASLPANNGSPIFNIQYELDASGTWISAGTTSDFTIGALLPATPYDVRLRAVNAGGSGPEGNTETATTGGTPLAAPFVFVVQTTGTNETVTIPCQNVGVFDAVVQSATAAEPHLSGAAVTAYNDTNLVLTFPAAGDHTVTISGAFPNIRFDNSGDRLKLIAVNDLGEVGWQNLNAAFFGCENLTTITAASGDMSNVTSFGSMLKNCYALAFITPMDNWVTATCTNIQQFFMDCRSVPALNGLGTWDVSNCTSTFRTFYGLLSLGAAPDLGNWNTASVTNMGYTFANSPELDYPVNGWNIEALNSNIRLDGFMQNSGVPTARYDLILNGWANQSVPADMNPDFGSSKYTPGSNAEDSRNELLTLHNWEILDSGPGTTKFAFVVRTTGVDETFTIRCQDVGVFNATVQSLTADAPHTLGALVTAWNDANLTLTFPVPGDHTVTIDGVFPNIHMNNTGDKLKIIEVLELGDVGWRTLESAFYGCENLVRVAGGVVTLVTDASSMLRNCPSLMEHVGVAAWDWQPENLNSMYFIAGAMTPSLESPPAFGDWDMSACFNLNGFLRNMPVLDYQIDRWDITALNSSARLTNFMNGSGMPTPRYDATLVAWAAQLPGVQADLTPHFGSSQYTSGSAAATARADLQTHGWTITDGGSTGAATDGPIGFGANTTGGTTPYEVTTTANSGAGSLRDAVSQPGRLITFTPGLTGSINWANVPRLHSNTTVDGEGADITITGDGWFRIRDIQNVIIRNLKITGTSGDSVWVTGPNTRNVWLDHLTVGQNFDGTIDITDGATDITISYCRFFDHNKTHLVGNNNSKTGDAAIRVTSYRNHFDTCDQRQPLIRYGTYHAFNNVFSKWGDGSTATNGECINTLYYAKVLAENNIFDAGANKLAIEWDSSPFIPVAGYVRESGSLRQNGALTPDNEPGLVPNVPYAYTLETADVTLKAQIIAEAGWQST